MKQAILSIIVILFAALSCLAESAATNATPIVVSVASATNTPAAKSTFTKATEDKLPRQQCEAVTKSGNRCKHNAAPGEKLCRQHQKIFRAKAGPGLPWGPTPWKGNVDN